MWKRIKNWVDARTDSNNAARLTEVLKEIKYSSEDFQQTIPEIKITKTKKGEHNEK
jgi:hypothetical protein